MPAKKHNIDSKQEQKIVITASDDATVLPVIEEHVVISKEVIETGKVFIRKRVKEEDALINIPLIQEGYQVERMPGKKDLLMEHPSVRHEEDRMIIPVVREVLVVEKRYEVLEEVHVIKTKREIPHLQEITLLKEEIQIERKSNI